METRGENKDLLPIGLYTVNDDIKNGSQMPLR